MLERAEGINVEIRHERKEPQLENETVAGLRLDNEWRRDAKGAIGGMLV